jgi:hypothetical protein
MIPIRELSKLIEAEDVAGIQALIAQFPDLRNDKSRPRDAASSGRLNALKALLEVGFSIHDRDPLSPKISLLRSGVYSGSLEMVNYLLSMGCDAGEPGILNSAVSVSKAMMQLLIDAGADPYSESGHPPRNAFQQAMISSTEETRAFLKTLRRPETMPTNPELVEKLQAKMGGTLVKLDRYLLAGAPFWMAQCNHGKTVSAVTVGLSESSWECEFRVVLPFNWPYTSKLGTDPYWPVDYLLDVLRSLQGQTGLPTWQTVANGSPAQPIAPKSNLVGGVFVSEMQDRDAPRVMTLVFLTAPELELARASTEQFTKAMGAAKTSPFQATELKRKSAL